MGCIQISDQQPTRNGKQQPRCFPLTVLYFARTREGIQLSVGE